MPYKRVGKTVYKKVDGWVKKGSSKSVGTAKAYIRLLQGIHHGMVPYSQKKKKK